MSTSAAVGVLQPNRQPLTDPLHEGLPIEGMLLPGAEALGQSLGSTSSVRSIQSPANELGE